MEISTAFPQKKGREKFLTKTNTTFSLEAVVKDNNTHKSSNEKKAKYMLLCLHSAFPSSPAP